MLYPGTGKNERDLWLKWVNFASYRHVDLRTCETVRVQCCRHRNPSPFPFVGWTAGKPILTLTECDRGKIGTGGSQLAEKVGQLMERFPFRAH